MSRTKSRTNTSNHTRLPLGIAAAVGAAGGLYVALTTRPTLLGMPIRADSFLHQSSADLPALHQVAVSFARGVVAVLHFGLWPLGSAGLAVCVALLVRELWRGDGAS